MRGCCAFAGLRGAIRNYCSQASTSVRPRSFDSVQIPYGKGARRSRAAPNKSVLMAPFQLDSPRPPPIPPKGAGRDKETLRVAPEVLSRRATGLYPCRDSNPTSGQSATYRMVPTRTGSSASPTETDLGRVRLLPCRPPSSRGFTEQGRNKERRGRHPGTPRHATDARLVSSSAW